MFVAGFIGSPQMNFLDGTIEKEGNEVVAIFGDNKIVFPKENAETLVKRRICWKNCYIRYKTRAFK